MATTSTRVTRAAAQMCSNPNPAGTQAQGFQILSDVFYERYLSDISRGRKPSPIWDLFPAELQPGMISMLAGKPNPTTFPFESISFNIRSQNPADGKTVIKLVLQGEELNTGLQYSQTSGLPVFIHWITQLMKEVHSRGDGEGWRVSIGCGSQDILYKAFSALFNPGETVLIEAPTYPAILPILHSLKCHVVEIISDAEGISVSALSTILANWDGDIPFPKLLYTVPFGSNPTGVTTCETRRVEVLKLARKYGFLIFEDDPYYFLYYGSSIKPASYFALEKTLGGELGRVVRFDSFSKTMAAGFRIGWATGPSRILDAIDLHSASSTVQPSSIAQIMLHKLLSEWGIPGFLSHTDKVADFYRQRRDYFDDCLQRHLGGLATWRRPDASMFFWVALSLPPTPGDHSDCDSSFFVRHGAVKHGVLLLPGSTAYIGETKTTYVRISFSLLDEDKMEEATKRIAAILREQWEQFRGTQIKQTVPHHRAVM